MKSDVTLRPMGRRDWLKSASLAVSAATLGRSQAAETTAINHVSTRTAVRGVVFLVSDGMSPGVLTLAQSFSLLTRKQDTAWWKLLANPASAKGLMDTASASSLVTDSAAASSAWGGGMRVNNGSINVSPDGKSVTPITAILKALKGKSTPNTGLVTTATVTHATPAGFAANSTSRGDENSIATQYLDRVDVILGGGDGYFDSKQRPDHRDLTADFMKAGYGIVKDRAGLLAARQPRLLGCFSHGHMPYSLDCANDPVLSAGIPTLSEMALAALDRFLESSAPFLLQVEGARIDHAAHLNDISALLGEQLAFDDVLSAVLARLAAHPDVLVVVTSDHGNSNPGLNGMGNGYQDSTPAFAKIARAKSSHERLFSDWSKSPTRTPANLIQLVKARIGFTLKPDEAAALLAITDRKPIVEWNHQLEKPEGLLGQFTGNHTSIGWTGTSHTADPTLVTALGPQAARFSGMVRNTDVFQHLCAVLA